MSIIKILQEQYLGEEAPNVDDTAKDNKIDNNESNKIKQGIEKLKGSIDKGNIEDKMAKVKSGIKDAKSELDPNLVQQLSVAYDMIQDYIHGEYKDIPWETILTLVAVLIYVVSPVDVIPDVIPVAGWLDDGWVITRLIPAIKKDVTKYQEWKSSQPNDEVEGL